MDDHHFFLQMGFTQVITFVQACKGNLCTTNHHLLVLNGHNLDFKLNVVHKARGWGWLDSLPPHTSHVLQPLEVACFKPFKLAFRSSINVWTLVHKWERVGFQRRPSTMDIFSFEKNIEFIKHHESFQDD
jgi:hypothetical protein